MNYKDIIHVSYSQANGTFIRWNKGINQGLESRVKSLEIFINNAISYCKKSNIDSIEFGVQIHDEEPDTHCFKFDACQKDNSNIKLIPDPYALSSNGYLYIRKEFKDLPEWDQRINIAIWRGASTGSNKINYASFKTLPRYVLCSANKYYPDLIDAKFTKIVQTLNNEEESLIKKHLNREKFLGNYIKPFDLALHKWIVDIDGNVNSWGFLWKLLSGSCVLKVDSSRKQWYYDSLKAWENYVPIKNDLSNIESILLWCRNNERSCRYIARKGQDLGEKIVREMYAYQIRAIETYIDSPFNKS